MCPRTDPFYDPRPPPAQLSAHRSVRRFLLIAAERVLLQCCCSAVAVLLQCCCSAVAVLLQCAPMRRRRRQATLRAAERSSSSCGNYVEGEQTAAHQRFGVGPVVHGLKQLRADHAVEAKLHSELLKEPDVRVHQHGRKIEHAAGKDRPAAEGGRRRIMDEEGA